MFTVEQILRCKESEVITASVRNTVREAVEIMADADVGCVLIKEGEEYVGIFSERDLVRRVVSRGLDPAETRVGDVMSGSLRGCAPDDDVATVVKLLNQLKVRHLPVVQDDRIVGLISARDVLNVILE